jgi:hypothetical protein
MSHSITEWLNSVQLAAEVGRRENCVDHTGIVADLTYVPRIGRSQDTVILATDVLKAGILCIWICVLQQKDILKFGTLIRDMKAEHEAEMLVNI